VLYPTSAPGDLAILRVPSIVSPAWTTPRPTQSDFYTPDVLAEICAELQVPFRSNGYRYWKEA